MDSENEYIEISSTRILISFGIIMFSVAILCSEFFKSSDIEFKLDPSLQINTQYSSSQSDKININTADKEELIKLKGVGKVVAGNIIEYRESHGGFSNIHELLNVKGIGNKFFEEIKDIICV